MKRIKYIIHIFTVLVAIALACRPLWETSLPTVVPLVLYLTKIAIVAAILQVIIKTWEMYNMNYEKDPNKYKTFVFWLPVIEAWALAILMLLQ